MKKALSVLLVFVMLLGMIPMAAFAAEAEHTHTYENGICTECGESILQPAWEQGTIASANGTNNVNATRFRTVDYNRLSDYSGVGINMGYTMTNFVYDENYTYLGTSSWLGAGVSFTTAELQEKYPNSVYFRVVFRRTDSLTLTMEDVSASEVKFYLPGEEIPTPELDYNVENVGNIGAWQDGAIWDGKLFVLGGNGTGAVYDLASLNKLGSLNLDKKNVIVPHANSVCFGSTYYAEGDKYPLLYVNIYNNYASAADRMEGTCCVYRITEVDGIFSTELVQVIEIGFTEDLTLWKSKENNGDVRPYGNFVVDTDAKKLYAFVMRDANSTTRFFGFDIPALSEGTYSETYGCNVITLEQTDIEAQFDTPYFSYLQGCCYSSGKIVSAEGFGGDAPLRIVDLKNQTVSKTFYLGLAGMTKEPEVVCVDPETGKLYYVAADGILRILELNDMHTHTYANGICTGCGAAQWDTDGDGALEILAIGNSFSVDALEYAYQIASDLGISEIAIGNLYIGGCSLNTHVTNAAGDLAKYTYYYNDSGTWTTTKSYQISTALDSRTWDFVSLQQASNYSGVESTYNEDLTDLIAYVQARSDARLVWHMTWAYQQNSTHSAFPTYGSDQMTMYNAIVSAVQNKIVPDDDFDLIVPNGTAVQNSRTSLLGDTTTRDGYHMSKDYGRYLTGLLFIKTVTGLSVDNITYRPSGVDAEEQKIAIESVNNAAKSPFALTQSAYTGEAPEDGYIELQSELFKGAFWHPLKDGRYNELITDMSNSHQYYATIRFTRDMLPVGSIIILEDGWQYRPDGWIADTLQTGTREPVTTQPYVVVTEEWWGDYTIRAFNISKVGLPSLETVTQDEVWDAFRIYVPEELHEHEFEENVCTLCGATNGPVITRQPVNGEAKLGERYCVTVEAEGEGLTYQWYGKNAGQKSWFKSSVTDNTYDDKMTSARADREVYCVITDQNGNSVTTDVVTLVLLPSEELAITQQPTDGEAVLGERYCVTVEAKGEELKYQWYFRNPGATRWTKSGVTDNTYDDILTKARMDREVYCVITDRFGNSVTTDTVKLVRVPMQLEITSQPADATAPFGELFCATVEARGEGLKYQWYYRNNGSEEWHKSGVHDNTYDDVMNKSRNGREIYCVITDQWGNTITSDTVKLIAVPSVELEILDLTYEAAPMGEEFCVTVEAQGEGLQYQWYGRNAASDSWFKSSVTDNTYDDVMNKTRANREVYCVITDAFGNQVTTDVVTLVPEESLPEIAEEAEVTEAAQPAETEPVAETEPLMETEPQTETEPEA